MTIPQNIYIGLEAFPINYNHYYTGNIRKCREAQIKKELAQSIDSARLIETKLQGGNSSNTVESIKPYGLSLNYRSIGGKAAVRATVGIE